MIGDSWQLRKHSLLGHWAAHSCRAPRTLAKWEEEERRREKVGGATGVGRAGREPRGGGGGARANTEGEIHTDMEGWKKAWGGKTEK